MYDAALQPVPLEVRFRRVAEDAWDVHVLVDEGGARVERGAAGLEVDAEGRLAHVAGDRSVYLRLPDGGWAQPLALNFGTPLDERGFHPVDPLAAYQEGNGGIWADGWSPGVCDGLQRESRGSETEFQSRNARFVPEGDTLGVAAGGGNPIAAAARAREMARRGTRLA